MGDSKMIRNRSLETSRSNTGCVEDGREVAQKEEKECGQYFLRNNSFSKRLSFFETFVYSRRVQGVRSCCLVFTVELICILYLHIFRLVKKENLSYFWIDRLWSGGGREKKCRLIRYERSYFEGAISCLVLLKVMGSCQEHVWTFRREGIK